MKYLIMCEGPNELEIIRMLLEHDKLIFTEDDLLNLVPYHARQIGNNAAVKTSPKAFSKENIVYNRKYYDNSTAFYRDYYGKQIDLLVDTMKRYKQVKGKHQKDELYLADLLK